MCKPASSADDGVGLVQVAAQQHCEGQAQHSPEVGHAALAQLIQGVEATTRALVCRCARQHEQNFPAFRSADDLQGQSEHIRKHLVQRLSNGLCTLCKFCHEPHTQIETSKTSQDVDSRRECNGREAVPMEPGGCTSVPPWVWSCP